MPRLTPIFAAILLGALAACDSTEKEPVQESTAVNQTAAESLLDKTIQFHDPDNKWPEYKTMVVQKSRMLREGDDTTAVRTRKILMDNEQRHFIVQQDVEDYSLIRTVGGDSLCETRWLKPDLTAEDSARMNLTCESARFYRDYFRYLLGLPMVLRDSATVLSDKVGEEELFGSTYQTLTVNYKPEGEHPEWTFFVDTTDYHLAAARFVKPDSTGEYIVFGDVTRHKGIRNFDTFKWYYLDKKPLATEKYTFR